MREERKLARDKEANKAAADKEAKKAAADKEAEAQAQEKAEAVHRRRERKQAEAVQVYATEAAAAGGAAAPMRSALSLGGGSGLEESLSVLTRGCVLGKQKPSQAKAPGSGLSPSMWPNRYVVLAHQSSGAWALNVYDDAMSYTNNPGKMRATSIEDVARYRADTREVKSAFGSNFMVLELFDERAESTLPVRFCTRMDDGWKLDALKQFINRELGGGRSGMRRAVAAEGK